MTDEINEAESAELPAADPFAKARAAKARKAAERAEADALASQREAASAGGVQPKRSKRKGATLVEDAKGPTILVRVTSQGRDHISTGGDFGFERFDMWAEIDMVIPTAFSLWKKNWIEPTEREHVVLFDKMRHREMVEEARRTAKFNDVLEHGARLGEDYRSDPLGPPSAAL